MPRRGCRTFPPENGRSTTSWRRTRAGCAPWNFDATSKSQLSAAAAALATDIQQAVATPNDKVVYSAGGGHNVAAEAIGYLYNQGYRQQALVEHFAVVQHGGWNNFLGWTEAPARALTLEFTIAISCQNNARYANGMDGPDLKHAIKGHVDGSAFGSDFDKALDVTTGQKGYAG